MAEATRIAIQTMAKMQTQRVPNAAGPKLDGPALKQPIFNWEAPDKYTEWKAFFLEVRNVLATYNAQEADKITMVKNWFGRKGLHYIETLTENKKEACSTLEGLFNTLATKFKLQYNKTVKGLQFRKLYRLENGSVDEWMGRLHVVVAECNYRELDRQLKEQFIHGLNDKLMLVKIIRELTAKNSNEQVTSEGMLIWAKRIEAQRAQATVLNNIMESCQFDKVKVTQKPKEGNVRHTPDRTGQQHPCRYCGGFHALRQCPAYRNTCDRCDKIGHLKKVCWSRKGRAVHELEVNEAQEVNEGEIETVSIDSVHLNKNWSLISAKLEMQAGRNTVEILYKVDTGSEGNIMPLFIFKKLFKNTTEEQL